MKSPTRRASTKRNAFLVEIVIVILFFSISVSVILQLFVAAHQKSQQSRDTNVAMIKAQEIAEGFQGLDSLELTQVQGLPYIQDVRQVERGAVTGRVLLDENWQPTEETGRYLIELQITEGIGQWQSSLKSSLEPVGVTGKLLHSEIKVLRLNQAEETELVTLQSDKYVPE